MSDRVHCQTILGHAYDFIRVSGELKKDYLRHVLECKDCRRLIHEEVTLLRAIRKQASGAGSGTSLKVPTEFRAKLLEAIRAQSGGAQGQKIFLSCPDCGVTWEDADSFLADPEVCARSLHINAVDISQSNIRFCHRQCKSAIEANVASLGLIFDRETFFYLGDRCSCQCANAQDLELCKEVTCSAYGIRQLTQEKASLTDAGD